MIRLAVDKEKCTGCRACMLECAAAHDHAFSLSSARIWIEQEESKWLFSPRVCRQCDDHPCIAACPSSAIVRDSTTGAIRIRSESCTACGLCAHACPYGGIALHPLLQEATVCDLCGGSPQCVEVCLPRAIVLEEV